jgi:acylglycerol lipase
MARLAVLFVCVILAACVPVTAPAGPADRASVVTTDAFVTHDGLRLPLRRWAATSPRAVIVALHGMNDYSNAFDMPATWWVGENITTYAYDQRGFGAAPNPGLWPGTTALDGDLTDFVAAVRNAHPGLPVYVLGESMGGAVALTAFASDHPPAADGLILVAPAVWSRADMPLHYRAALWLTAHTVPWMTLTGRGLHIWPSDNIDMLRRFARDPLVLKQTRSDAVWGLVDLMDAARRAAPVLRAPPPVLMVYGEHDQVIPRGPTEAVAADLKAHAAAEVRVYPKGYHMLLRDLHGADVWRDIAAWVRTTAAPSSR